MSATTALDDLASVELERDERAFRVDYEPSPLATGWMLRERHHDGWPIMAGPFDTRQDAIDGIEELLEAGPLCCYEDENGYQSCWGQARLVADQPPVLIDQGPRRDQLLRRPFATHGPEPQTEINFGSLGLRLLVGSGQLQDCRARLRSRRRGRSCWAMPPAS